MTVIDLRKVRDALHQELTARRYVVARDTAGSNGQLYVQGDGDRAAALFECKADADDACVSMYQGSWLPSLPPRFAVLPDAERLTSSVDFLRQAGLSVLFYTAGDSGVVFAELEEAFEEITRRSAKAS
jgi:hypothetical protein